MINNQLNKKMVFKKNDIVECKKHSRLMVVERYHFVDNETISNCGFGNKIVVSEGGYYKESDLTIVFRRKN